MTLDDHTGWREAARATEEFYAEQARIEWETQRACESIEAEEQHWIGVMAAMPEHMKDTHYQGGPG